MSELEQAQPTETVETRYRVYDPYQLQYLQRAAEQYKDAIEITVIPTDTPEQIEAAAKEWSEFEENSYYLDRENAFDYIRRTDRTAYERLLLSIPEMIATGFLVKEVQRNTAISHYEFMREYYEPTEPKSEEETEYGQMVWDLHKIFEEGGDLRYRYQTGFHRLAYQIAHDNPELDKFEVIRQAWILIPEATSELNDDEKAMIEEFLPKTIEADKLREQLAIRAIRIHEEHEAERRVAE